jgi:hypothetical protein
MGLCGKAGIILYSTAFISEADTLCAAGIRFPLSK